jgi:enolase
MKIKQLSASMILDSKGRPTIRVGLKADNVEVFSCAPSGTSVGKFEAQAFPKEGVDKAVTVVNREIGKQLVGLQVHGLEEIDNKLRSIDGTDNFSRIGGNAATAISTVVAKALADIEGKMLCEYLCENGKMLLPFPLSNVIGGGRHTVGDTLDFQEFLVIPTSAKTFVEAAMFNVQVHKEVGDSIIEKHAGYVLGRNDEGAWAAPLKIEEALKLLSSAIEKVGNTTGIEGKIGIDIAASELWDGRRYEYKKEKRLLEANEQLSYISELTENYDVIYLEDPFQEEDFSGFARLNERLGKRSLVAGDDLIVTNPKRLQTAIDKHSISGAIIKPNQVGTLTDVRTTVNMARRSKIVPIASHRSGETSDTALAHIAVGLKCPIMKIGISGGERLEKINELMKIERTVGAPMAQLR